MKFLPNIFPEFWENLRRVVDLTRNPPAKIAKITLKASICISTIFLEEYRKLFPKIFQIAGFLHNPLPNWPLFLQVPISTACLHPILLDFNFFHFSWLIKIRPFSIDLTYPSIKKHLEPPPNLLPYFGRISSKLNVHC